MEFGNRDTHTRRIFIQMKVEIGEDTITSQGKLKIVSQSPVDSLMGHKRNQLCGYFDFRLLASRTVRQRNFVCVSHLVCYTAALGN